MDVLQEPQMHKDSEFFHKQCECVCVQICCCMASCVLHSLAAGQVLLPLTYQKSWTLQIIYFRNKCKDLDVKSVTMETPQWSKLNKCNI